MKYILFGSLLLLTLALQGCARSAPSQTNAAVPRKENSNEPLTLFRSENGKKEYMSKPYGFSIIFNDVFSPRLDLQMKNEQAHTIIITRLNADTRQDAHRDTPIEFNTSGEDRIMLTISPNTGLLSSGSAESDFLKWHSLALPSQTVVQRTRLTVGNHDTLFALEEDGVAGSVGQYFYVFGTKYILTIGSDDVPKSELLPIVESITWY